MKVSKAEKDKTRKKIIEAAVSVITKKGYGDATMRDIAKAASVGDATIYKYFPAKEDILYGYFSQRVEDLIDRIREIPDFEKYSLQEQLHSMLETKFELLEKERAFVQIAFENVFHGSWLGTAGGARLSKARFIEIIEDLVTSAVDAGEIPEPPFRQFLYELSWEYVIGITYYWVKDESSKRVNTTALIDKSLSLIVACLKAGILARAVEIGQFLIREHLLARLRPEKPDRNFDFSGGAKKKKFMAPEKRV